MFAVSNMSDIASIHLALINRAYSFPSEILSYSMGRAICKIQRLIMAYHL